MTAQRPTSASLVLTLAGILVACQSDDLKLKDHESPKITFVEEQQAKNNVKGVFDLTFNLKDNLNVARIEVFVDEVRIADEKLSNPQETYSLKWNSKSVSDGNHKLKIVATDTAGNLGEQSFDLEVDNFLLSVTVPSDYLPESQFESWIFLSDNDGRNLGTQQIENGKILGFPFVDGFTETKLNFTIFYKRGQNSLKDVDRSIYTFTNVPIGDIQLRYANDIDPNINKSQNISVQGTVTVTIRDIEAGYTQFVYSGKNVAEYNTTFSDDGLTATSIVGFTGSPSGILLTAINRNKPGGKYSFLNAVKLKDSFSLSMTGFSNLKEYEIPVPDASSSWEMNFGYTASGDNYYLYNNAPKANILPGYYMEPEMFSSYTNTTFATIGNTDYYYRTHGSQPHKTFKKLDASVQDFNISEDKITFKTTGSADFARITGITSSVFNGITFHDIWHVVTDAEVACKLPTIPNVIIQQYFPEGYPLYNFSYLNLFKDSRSSGSYENYINEIFFKHAYPSEIESDYEAFDNQYFLSSASARSANTYTTSDNVWFLSDCERAFLKKK